jgi:A118 family predicted phage portal protein
MAIFDGWFGKKLYKNRNTIYNLLDYRFNEGLIDSKWHTNPENIFTRTLLENSKWQSGIVEELEYFYKITYPKLIGYNATPIISFFWHKVTPKTIRVHSGIPALISKTMVSLIAAPGINYEVEENEEATQRLFEILQDNHFEDKVFPEGVIFESYGGYFAFKISQDDEITKFPIIELVSPENIEVMQERGRIVGYVFKHHKIENDDDIEIHEIYRKLGENQTEITYKKYKYQQAKLVEATFEPQELKEYEDVIVNAPLPAVLKNNTAINTQFKGAPYGLSDYANSQSIFNSLDEVLSQMMTAIRFARPKRFISEDLLVNTASGRKSQFDDFETDYEIVQTDPDNQSEQYKQFDATVDIFVYKEAFNSLVQQALNNAGLSPTSVGLTGLEALAASAESQREREKTTLRTREMKLKLWREALKELFTKLLQFDDVVNKNQSPGEYEISISFNDYSIPSFEQRIETATSALNGGLVDVKHAIDILFLDDLTDEEKEILVQSIKIENGIPITPDEVESLADNLPDTVTADIEEPEEPFLEEEDEEEEQDEERTTT